MLEPSHRARTHAAAETCRALQIGQQAIADALGVSQSQVSRVLSGNQRRWSRLAEDVCLHVERRAAGGITAEAVRANPDLVAAMQAVWDGTSGHAKALSTVIRSLAVLYAPANGQLQELE